MPASGDIDATIGDNDSVSDAVQYPLIELYLAVSLRLFLATAIFIAAGFVGLTIRRSNRITESLHFFFMANLMIADVGVAVIQNGMPIVNILMTIVNPDTEGIDCRILGATSFPYTASSMLLAVACFDRLYTIVGYKYYKNSKKRGFIAVIIVWVVSLIAGSSCLGHSQSDSTTSKTDICYDNYFEYFEFGISMLSLALADCFTLAQGIYLYYKCVIDVKDMMYYGSDKPFHSGLRKAWSKFRETQKASVALLAITGSSTVLGILIPTIIEAVQPHTGSLTRTILVTLVYCTIVNINILLHAVFYGMFLYTINEMVKFNFQAWINNVSWYCCYWRRDTQHYID